jgi:hypothetical protein
MLTVASNPLAGGVLGFVVAAVIALKDRARDPLLAQRQGGGTGTGTLLQGAAAEVVALVGGDQRAGSDRRCLIISADNAGSDARCRRHPAVVAPVEPLRELFHRVVPGSTDTATARRQQRDWARAHGESRLRTHRQSGPLRFGWRWRLGAVDVRWSLSAAE